MKLSKTPVKPEALKINVVEISRLRLREAVRTWISAFAILPVRRQVIAVDRHQLDGLDRADLS